MSDHAIKFLRGAILLSIRNGNSRFVDIAVEDFLEYAGLPAEMGHGEITKLITEARDKTKAFECAQHPKDDINNISGVCTVFSSCILCKERLFFELPSPMCMLSEQDLNRLLPLKDT